jgi:putative ABC transport system permease protein
MGIWQTVHIAVAALGRAKMRSFLTVLGVIIGVGAVIAMVSIGEGAKARVAATFDGMGTNTLVIRSGASRGGGVRGGAGSQPSITWDDARAIESEIGGITAVVPELQSSNVQVVGEEGNWQTQVVGTTPAWFTVRNLELEAGEPFSDGDVAGQAKVAIIGQTVATNLFGDLSPVGQTIRINRIPFQVIGLAEAKGMSPFGSDNDDRIIIPVTAYTSKIARGGVQKYIGGSLLVSAPSRDATVKAQAAIEELLRQRHRIRDGAEDDFSVRDPSEIAQAQQDSAATITSLLAGVALVSLIVGGIGIMNIMLVSVTERTREIGLRMAVGASGGWIRMQFLVEAALLSVAGGLIGLAAGIGAGRYLASSFGFPALVRTDIVVLAIAVSAFVGIAFGFYPAHKASRLDPITALRYE